MNLELEGKRGGAVDAADHAALTRFVTGAGGQLGGIDVLVYAPTAAMGAGNDPASWEQGVAVDLVGAVRACEAAIPMLQDSPAGAIVMIGTASIVEAVGIRRAYNSVKAGLVPYVKFLASPKASFISGAHLLCDGARTEGVHY
jgi:NAD(P)-dependent dehydrogenase (short-subunit alcohol dehydrogenase family)